jgi:heptosyltransferase-2
MYICKRLIEEKDIKIIVIGSLKEKENIDFFITKVGIGVEKFIHKDILYIAALIKHSDLFLGNDSSLMHIAASLGKPTIAIWGFTDYTRISPYGNNSLIIRKSYNCIPCYTFEYGCRCFLSYECLKGLNKEEVYSVISYIIDKIKEGNYLESLDFKNINFKEIKILWFGAKMLVLR